MDTLERLRALSGRDLAMLGVHAVAYIKPVMVDGHEAFAVHSADGREMAVIADREVAFATVRQNDLEPVSVH
jgi:hypothetical protein